MGGGGVINNASTNAISNTFVVRSSIICHMDMYRRKDWEVENGYHIKASCFTWFAKGDKN